jgi:hypothetical protein
MPCVNIGGRNAILHTGLQLKPGEHFRDAVEGNQSLRDSGTRPDYEQWLEARTVAGVKAFPDWFVLT